MSDSCNNCIYFGDSDVWFKNIHSEGTKCFYCEDDEGGNLSNFTHKCKEEQ